MPPSPRKCGESSSAATARATSGDRSGIEQRREREERCGSRPGGRRAGLAAGSARRPSSRATQARVDPRRRLAERRRILADQPAISASACVDHSQIALNSGSSTRNALRVVVRIAGVAVRAREVHEAVVGGVARPLARVDVARGRAARSGATPSGGSSTAARARPTPGCVEPGLPRVHDRRQPAAARVAALGEVGVLGGQAREQRAAGSRRRPGCGPRPRAPPRVQRRLRDPGGGEAADALSQNAGPGKYASSGTSGWKTMCGTRPSPTGREQRLELGGGARRVDPRPADRDVGGVPAPLVRILAARRDGRAHRVQLAASTASAAPRSAAVIPSRRPA